MNSKQELRRTIKQQKQRYTQEELRKQSEPIISRLLAHPAIRQASTILFYHSLLDEVFTHDAITRLVNDGKQILLPKVIGERMTLLPYSAHLQQGAFGIYEPEDNREEDNPGTKPRLFQTAVIPGVAFDSQGHRLGRGKGYYDRYFNENIFTTDNLPRPYLIGLCFPFQLLEAIPAEPHDLIVDEVIC